MAKAAYGVKDAVKAEFGIQAGNVRIAGICSKVHQFPVNSKTGAQSDPFGCVQIEFELLDASFEPKGDDTVKMEFGYGSMEKFHPGKATGADDDDPEDLGDELDVEGNCIYSDGSKLSTNTSWIRLTDSMEKVGFKPEVLGNGFLPDLIGTVGHVHTDTLEKWPGYKGAKDPTQLVFDKIVTFPYEGKGKGKGKGEGGGTNSGKGTSSAAKPTSKTASSGASSAGTGAGKKETAPASTGDCSWTIDGEKNTGTSVELATAVLSSIAADSGGKTMDLKSLKSKATAKLMRMKVPVPQHKLVFAHLGDEDFLTETGSETELFGYDADEGNVIFPE